MADENVKTTQGMCCGSPKRWSRWLCHPGVVILVIVMVLFCALVFHILGRYIVCIALEPIYTPPALTREKADVYVRFIKIVKAHAECETISLTCFGSLCFDASWCHFDRPDSVREFQREKGFSIEEMVELAAIYKDFKRVGCVRAEKFSRYVVFWPAPSYILPRRPGVLYSLDGQNPNEEVFDQLIKHKKPFLLIKDSWYTSRRLTVSPLPREGGEWDLPKSSLIDHSLRDPGPIPPG